MSDNPLAARIGTPKQWENAIQEHGCPAVSIHELDQYDSASKIGIPQYLALRALWKRNRRAVFKPSQWGIQDVATARGSLKGLAHWDKFLQAVPLEIPMDRLLPVTRDLGELKLIWYYGQLIRWAPESPDNEDNVRFTPVSKGTRFQQKLMANRNSIPSTPTPRPQGLNGNRYFGDLRLGGDQTPDPKGTPSTDFDPESPEDDVSKDPTYRASFENFPPVSDENVVNTYLVGLASLVTMSCEGVKAHWSQQRRGYKVCKDQTKLYEARTDGHLFLTDGKKTRAIVEVKPMMRHNAPTVMMQETAEMAAWIHECPDEILSDTPRNQMFRRLLFSQNRHEIYLIIADYNADYVEYLTKSDRSSNCDSFLTMNQFGPWDIGNKSDVEDIASIIRAVTLQFSKGRSLI